MREKTRQLKQLFCQMPAAVSELEYQQTLLNAAEVFGALLDDLESQGLWLATKVLCFFGSFSGIVGRKSPRS